MRSVRGLPAHRDQEPPERAPGTHEVLRQPLELLRLGVDPAWRRAGIGGELVARGLALGLDRGFTACFLEVRTDNSPARRLYERLGFALAGERRRYYGDGTDAAIYRRTLRG